MKEDIKKRNEVHESDGENIFSAQDGDMKNEVTGNKNPLKISSVSAVVEGEDTDKFSISDSEERFPQKQKKQEIKKQPEPFDWDKIEKDENHEAYSEERSRLEEMYNNSLSQITELQIVEGEVIGFGEREVFVNIGYKSDGIIPISEFRYNPDLKTGDKIDVYIENTEDNLGQLLLSHKKARLLKSWNKIIEIHEKGEIINGYVKYRTKGGFIVDVFGIEAFLPGSQIDVKPIRDYDVYVDKVMELKVVKINHEFKNVVVSHKVLIEDELELQKTEIIKKLEKGQILEGTVKNITSYGVFIDLGGIDGLIHITDLSWGRISHPEEILKLDQNINVVILDFDESKKRIALGLKQLTPHPWDLLPAELNVGDKVKGRIVVLTDYGAFIEIMPGIEGLIHVSEMSWSQYLRTAQDFLKINDVVETVILTLDREERKMSLGIKQLIPDPWINIKEKYPINSKHKAIVKNFTNFGAFVELEEGVDGLIHISDLSWSKRIKHPAEFVKINDEIEVIVLEVNVENRRLNLGHKQLEENPYEAFESLFTEGSVHKGTVIEITEKNATVALPYGVEAFVSTRNMQKENGKTIKLDETDDFMITEFSKDNRKIVVSHSKIWKDKKKTESTEKQKINKKTTESKTSKSEKEIQDKIIRAKLGDTDAMADIKTDDEPIKEKKTKTSTRSTTKTLKTEDEPKTKDTMNMENSQDTEDS